MEENWRNQEESQTNYVIESVKLIVIKIERWTNEKERDGRINSFRKKPYAKVTNQRGNYWGKDKALF